MTVNDVCYWFKINKGHRTRALIESISSIDLNCESERSDDSDPLLPSCEAKDTSWEIHKSMVGMPSIFGDTFKNQ